MRAMSPRERKLVAIGLLVLAVALVQLVVIGPILNGFADRAAQRERLLLEYQHNARAIASIPRIRRQAEAQRGTTERFAIDAASPEQAHQLLRERIERVVGEVGGEFEAGEDADAPEGWVGVRTSARLTLDQLTRTLARLQSEPPWLVVTALDVSADQALVNGRLNPMETTFEAQVPTRSPQPR